jgi:hypothetical protein
MPVKKEEPDSITSWYKKQRVTIQGAILGGLFVLLAALVTGMCAIFAAALPQIIEGIRPNEPIVVVFPTPPHGQTPGELPAVAPTIFVPRSEVEKVFPIFVGSSWSYNFGTIVEAGGGQNGIVKAIGTYTETIITIETGLSDKVRIVNAKVIGENFMTECNWGELFTGETEIWYVVDDTRIFQVCSRDDAYKIANGIIHNDAQSIFPFTPEYIMPLEVGKLWPAFSDLPPRDDTAYQWFVEAKVPVIVPAGQYVDCYRLLLSTLGDATIHWVCPGTGVVAKEYHHRAPQLITGQNSRIAIQHPEEGMCYLASAQLPPMPGSASIGTMRLNCFSMLVITPLATLANSSAVSLGTLKTSSS